MDHHEDKWRADDKHNTKEKAVKSQREKTGPYASEVDDYADDAVKSPEPDPRRTETHSAKKSKCDTTLPIRPAFTGRH
jgi:hypothetical protein